MNASNASAGSRFWFLLSGGLTIAVGIAAIAMPYLATGVIAQLIGIFCVASGAFLFASAIFAKTRKHRVFDLLAASLRVILGILLLANLFNAVLALTLLLAAVFVAEGVTGLVLAFQLKGKNPAWLWILANGVVALVLGGLLFAKWPSDSPWAIGLLFGINSLFLGLSLIMFGLGLGRAREA